MNSVCRRLVRRTIQARRWRATKASRLKDQGFESENDDPIIQDGMLWENEFNDLLNEKPRKNVLTKLVARKKGKEDLESFWRSLSTKRKHVLFQDGFKRSPHGVAIALYHFNRYRKPHFKGPWEFEMYATRGPYQSCWNSIHKHVLSKECEHFTLTLRHPFPPLGDKAAKREEWADQDAKVTASFLRNLYDTEKFDLVVEDPKIRSWELVANQVDDDVKELWFKDVEISEDLKLINQERKALAEIEAMNANLLGELDENTEVVQCDTVEEIDERERCPAVPIIRVAAHPDYARNLYANRKVIRCAARPGY